MTLTSVAVAIVATVAFLHVVPASAAQREYSFDLWDWTAPGGDLPTFRKWAEDLKSIGVTRIEMSAPWNRLEPRPGEYDLSYISERLEVAKSLGLGLRIRINSYWAGATPAWYDGDRQVTPDGKPAPMGIPSINDDRFWARYAPMCTEVARRFRGEDIYYNAFIGMHAELKWADWWTFDPSSLKAWQEAIYAEPRPAWLARVVGDAPLPDVPVVPGPTEGRPDNAPASKAFIAFREQSWRVAVSRFADAIYEGDPGAKVSAPLGEAFRRQSAEFSNQDYWGLSRHAKQVVHSYDFFMHHKDLPWHAAAAVASFRGITGLPVVFEFDGPTLYEQFHYTDESLLAIARAAISQGAVLKCANFSYSPKLPSQWPVLARYGQLLAAAGVAEGERPAGETVLLFVSKWANYCYREKTEWLHDAQFGAWKMLTDGGWPVRVICEDNLGEDLAGYKAVYVAYSPMELMPAADQGLLTQLCSKIPSIIEITSPLPTPALLPSSPPTSPPSSPPTSPSPPPLEEGSLTLGYPLAYRWLHDDDRSAHEAALARAFGQLGVSKP